MIACGLLFVCCCVGRGCIFLVAIGDEVEKEGCQRRRLRQ